MYHDAENESQIELHDSHFKQFMSKLVPTNLAFVSTIRTKFFELLNKRGKDLQVAN